MEWDKLASESVLKKTVKSLEENGIKVFVVDNGKQAKEKVLEIIPKGSEVFNSTSATLDTIGVSKEIVESGKFDSIRKKFMSMDRNTQAKEMKQLGAVPDWIIGSVHAVTEDGKVLVASASGSQLPAYANGAGKVLWVVGTNKIVKNMEDGIKRIYEYSLPLEDARARKVYGMGSGVNKLLIINKERPERTTMILVKEKLGF